VRLAGRRALVIGAGGLGGPAAIGLAAAGVGLITLVDDDEVEPTNLGRQVLFGDSDVGASKVGAAARALQDRFPALDARPVHRWFRADEVGRALVTDHDIVLDGSDNFPTRFAANDLCVASGVPLVHGAALRWAGQLLTILPGKTACLRCVFEGEPPAGAAPTCAQAGVLSPLVGVVGAWMAEAAIEWLTGGQPRTAGSMRVFDAWRGVERLAPVGRDPSCAACGRVTA